MISIYVTIQVKPGFRDRFVEASLDDAKGSVRDEPGCFRFDILQNDADPNRIHLYEVYADEAALESHRNSPHYKSWRSTVQDWIDGDVRRIATTSVFPSDEGWQRQKPTLLHW